MWWRRYCNTTQVLITTDSCHVHREVARTMPILRRYSRAKLNPDQVQTMGKVLDTYTEWVLTALDVAQPRVSARMSLQCDTVIRSNETNRGSTRNYRLQRCCPLRKLLTISSIWSRPPPKCPYPWRDMGPHLIRGKKMRWHFSEQRWEWSGGCVALT